MTLTAKQTMERDLRLVQRLQADCVDEYQIVKPYRRYEYQKLVRQASELRAGIEYFDNLKNGRK